MHHLQLSIIINYSGPYTTKMKANVKVSVQFRFPIVKQCYDIMYRSCQLITVYDHYVCSYPDMSYDKTSNEMLSHSKDSKVH